MKVLHIFKTYFPDTSGGLEQVIRQICLSTIPYGYGHTVVCLSKSATPAIVIRPEARVVRYPELLDIASTPVGVRFMAGARALIKHTDIVHYHYPWPVGDMVHSLWGRRHPSIVTYHSDITKFKQLKYLYKPLMNSFLGSVDTIVATSDNYLETSADLARFKPKCTVIPIGIDEASYPEPEQETMARWEQRLGRGFFLFIGVLRYYKGLHLLLNAIKGASFKLVIVGSGPMESSLKQQAITLGLNNVVFTGYVSDEDKVALLRLCRAVVFPSHIRSEAFGVTLVEGAMFGKPLISTELGTGTSFVNKHGETGYVVPPSNPEALRQAMERLARDDARDVRMGRMARVRYLDLLTADRMGRLYVNAYQGIS